MTYMLDEIREQPGIVADVCSLFLPLVEEIASEIKQRNIRSVYIAARGTSDHVAHYAKYAIEIETGIPVALAAPSVYTLYHAVPRVDGQTLVIGISQSGAGPDVVEVCRSGRRAGALTIAITNTVGSDLASAVDYAIVTPAGREMSVAATKTYTSALAVVALLTSTLSTSRRQRFDELLGMSVIMNEVLNLGEHLAQVSESMRFIPECVVLGRGYNHCTAAEMALKLMETSLIGAKAFSAADFVHGPIAIASPGLRCLLVAPTGPTFDNMVEISERLAHAGCTVMALTNSTAFETTRGDVIPMPTMPEWLTPLAYIVAGQLFAHGLCLAKGLNPDQPRGLSKVTLTV